MGTPTPRPPAAGPPPLRLIDAALLELLGLTRPPGATGDGVWGVCRAGRPEVVLEHEADDSWTLFDGSRHQTLLTAGDLGAALFYAGYRRAVDDAHRATLRALNGLGASAAGEGDG